MITKQFVTAGKATFTIHNNRGDHFTFKVTRGRTTPIRPNPGYFVSVKQGHEYRYVGMLDLVNDRVRLTHKSQYKYGDLPVKVFNFAMQLITGRREITPPGYDVQHEGMCAACGRPLTDPESIRTGFGPVCRERL